MVEPFLLTTYHVASLLSAQGLWEVQDGMSSGQRSKTIMQRAI